jgi:hypothetical protein
MQEFDNDVMQWALKTITENLALNPLDKYLSDIIFKRDTQGYICINKEKMKELLLNTITPGKYYHDNPEIQDFMRKELDKPENRYEINKAYAESVLGFKLEL